MNFFDPAFQTRISATAFGLCDNGTGGQAYTDCEDPTSWIATVRNPDAEDWIFTAIDKGAIADCEFAAKGRCDGMLSQDRQTLVLVELKDQQKGWIPHAIQQLADTIELFQNTHPSEWDAFIKKRAYACNKRHPFFQHSHNEDRLRFFQCYKVRLNIEATISL